MARARGRVKFGSRGTGGADATVGLGLAGVAAVSALGGRAALGLDHSKRHVCVVAAGNSVSSNASLQGLVKSKRGGEGLENLLHKRT